MGILDWLDGKKTKEEKQPSIEVKITTTKRIEEDRPSNFYLYTKLSNNDYLLNPGASFELTLYNCDEDAVKKLISILDHTINLGNYQTVRSIAELLIAEDIRCREIDAYVDGFKPKYELAVKEFCESNPQWENANLLDKEDILAEASKIALESIEIRPDVELEILFKNHPWLDITPRRLLNKYPIAVIKKYIEVWDKNMKVKVVPADNMDRNLYEEMVHARLARRGKDIPLAKILETLKMAQLNQIASSFSLKIPNKKDVAVKILSEVEGIEEFLDKNISYRELFQLVPLTGEFTNINIDRVREFIYYLEITADLIGRTYHFAYYTDRNLRNDYFRDEYEIRSTNDMRTCPYCRKMAGKYSKQDKPKLPLHLACRCTVSPTLK